MTSVNRRLVMSRPTQTDLAVSPELAILTALRVSSEIAADTLRTLIPIDESVRHCRDSDALSAATIVYLAEALRLAILDYEQRMSGANESV
jgi:hypothetical protein